MTGFRAARILACTAILLPAWPLRADWRALGPFGGDAAVVATDPHQSKTVIAGTRNALLFRSRDAGESWIPLPFPAQLRAVLHTFAIDPRTPGLYLAGLSSDLPQYSGVLRSADSGATWQQVAALRGLEIRAIAYFRGNTQIVAAGTNRGVFRSANGGVDWSRISPEDNPELQPIVSIAFDPNNSAILYAGTPHLPWKTEDGGVSWRSIHPGMVDDSDVFSIMVDRNRPRQVVAGACSGIYRSLSGGASWTRSRQAPDTSDRTYVIVQDPQYENVLFAGTKHGMVRSGDGGITWQKLLPYATHSIAFDMRRLGRIFIATDEAGILRSEDGGKTWKPANEGFSSRHLTSMGIGGVSLYTSGFNGRVNGWALKLASSAGKWEPVPPTSPFFNQPLIAIASAASDGRTLFAAVPDGVLVSHDGGGRWTQILRAGRGQPLKGLAAPSWAPKLLIAGTAGGLWVSQNAGEKWESAKFPPADADIRTLLSSSPWMIAVGDSAIFLSGDGRHWEAGALPAVGAEVYDVVATGEGSLLAATSAGMRASTDRGATWQVVPGEFEASTVQALARHPRRTSLLFAAQFGVLYRSQDGGRWTRISPAAWPVTSVKQIAVVPGTPDRLLALTPQQGIFVLELDTETVPENPGYSPTLYLK